jgi:hypothetical protein
MLVLMMYLGNLFIKGYHLPLGRVAWFSVALGSFMVLVYPKGFLDVLQGYK